MVMLSSWFSDWIRQFLACVGGCFGCCTNPAPVIAVDEPSKWLRIQGQLVRKPSISDGFWSTSTWDMDSVAFQSQRSLAYISIPNQILNNGSGTASISNQSDFVNHGLLLWNQTRVDWVGNGRSINQIPKRRPILSWNSSYESLLSTKHPLRHPIPLSEVVDFLVDVWEQEGLYD